MRPGYIVFWTGYAVILLIAVYCTGSGYGWTLASVAGGLGWGLLCMPGWIILFSLFGGDEPL